ncbi:MAG: T9SS type A sorting domain-containing protein, partial [Saprospiraceae bacterium]
TQWLTIDGKVASTPTHQKAILEIKDYLGRTISRQSLPISDQLHYRMDIDRLSHGWYLVEITSTLGTWKQKFVKQ